MLWSDRSKSRLSLPQSVLAVTTRLGTHAMRPFVKIIIHTARSVYTSRGHFEQEHRTISLARYFLSPMLYLKLTAVYTKQVTTEHWQFFGPVFNAVSISFSTVSCWRTLSENQALAHNRNGKKPGILPEGSLPRQVPAVQPSQGSVLHGMA